MVEVGIRSLPVKVHPEKKTAIKKNLEFDGVPWGI
jgi:hypothetical protein